MDYLTLSKAKSITLAPMVPASLRKEYEAYTQQHQEWIQRGLDLSSTVRRSGTQQIQLEEQHLLQGERRYGSVSTCE